MLSPPYSPHGVLVEEIIHKRASNTSNEPSPLSSTADSTLIGDYDYGLKRSSQTAFSDEMGISSDNISDNISEDQSEDQSDTATVNDDDDDDVSVRSVSVSLEPSSHHSLRHQIRRHQLRQNPSCKHTLTLGSCFKALKTDPASYLLRERSFLDLYPLRRHSWAGPGAAGLPLDADSSLSTSTSPNGSGSRGTRGRRPKTAGNGNGGPGRGRRRVPAFDSGSGALAQAGDDELSTGSQQAAISSQSQSAGSTNSSQVRVHDLQLHQIEDYAPPLSSLPPGKSLRAEWKGAPMDLSNDPDLHLLHPAEAHLASVLRLPCEVYLDSKRRLFAEKVHRLKQGLPFRRTDSQKACRIDVNKASRLFGAFEKIGWLQDDLFAKYLE